MQIVSEVNQSILTIINHFFKNDKSERWSQYCVHSHITDGVLVFNLLTRELVLLSYNEYLNFQTLDYLKENWFVISEEIDEKRIADVVKWVLATRQSKTREIVDYTIFTTTDCNARCFYCFELGRSRIPMSCETAEKIVQYIKQHSGKKKIRIGWFGGEPLFNAQVIDTITEGLHSEEIEFVSTMVSNGYLFDNQTVEKAVTRWNLSRVQITLDGTENIYNKVKAYIYKDESPYKVVMRNIASLLDAGIKVVIRLNIDLYNAEDLCSLALELANRFSGFKGISIYIHHLFKGGTPNAELHTDEEWNKLESAMDRLKEILAENGLLARKGIRRNIKQNFCMADSGSAVTILPDGHIGLCEHFTESEFVGHLDTGIVDTGLVAAWKERTPEIPECTNCFYFLDCIKLQKCSSNSVCYPRFRQEKLKNCKNAMEYEYERWLTRTAREEYEDNVFC